MNINVYKQEQKDGLADKIRNNTITYASLLIKDDKPVKIITDLNKYYSQADANPEQFDLFYMKDIMVSSVWNDNDDVFLNYEVFRARKTPEDKPLNLNHDHSQIVGHITSQYVIDDSKEATVISDDTKEEDLPEKIHIVSGSVVYKYWKDPKFMEQIAEITEGISKGEWSVSMECLYPNYDYAVVNEDGKTAIVKRTDATAWLTKYLRAYGGDGVYQKFRIGRIIRDLAFSGKGLTQNPANPDSKAFSATNAAFKLNYSGKIEVTSANIVYSDIYNMEKMKMEETLKTEIAELKTANANLQKQLTESNVKTIQAKNEELVTEVKTLSDKVVEANKALVAEVAKVEEVTKLKIQVEAKVVEIEKQFGEVKAELNKINEENKKNDRIKTVVAKFGVEEAKATEIVADLAELSDEKFNKYVEANKKVATVVETKVVTEVSKTEAAKVLENAEVVDNKVISATEDKNTVDQDLAKSVAKFFTKPKTKKNVGE